MGLKFSAVYGNIIRWGTIGIAAVLLLILNYCSLSEHLASNNRYITDYALPDDYEERNRPTVVAGLFYDLNKKQEQPVLKILQVPVPENQYAFRVAEEAYLSLKPDAGKIKNIILVVSGADLSFEGAGIITGYASMPEKTKINREISAALAKDKNFSSLEIENGVLFDKHLRLLQKALPSFKAVLIAVKGISAKTLAKALEPYVSRSDTVVVLAEGLAAGESAEPDKTAHQTVLYDGLMTETASFLAEKYNYTPEVIDFVQTVRSGKKGVYWEWKGNTGENKNNAENRLINNVESLKNFKKIYASDLQNIAEEALNRALFDASDYKPSRKDYDDRLFDRGAAYISLFVDGKLRGRSGSVVAAQGIARNVAENVYNAVFDKRETPPLSPDEIKKIKINISLLSGFEKIPYKNEKDLLNKIVPGKDGLVIRSGNRQAVFLPSVWQKIADRREFLNQLKFKAGMNPNYWSNEINVYRFYTVEIKENEN